MAYQFMTQYNSGNFTPQNECVSVWGVPRRLLASEGAKIAIHWWGDPNTNPSIEGVISTLCNPSRGASAHLVATGTGRRVACLVDMADASWATNSANPFTFSIECDPRCRDEDYDVVAEVIADLRSDYGDLPLVPHKMYSQTACPGNYDLGRLDALARKKISGNGYGNVTNVAPPTPPVPVDARPEWEKNFQKYSVSITKYAIDNITPLRGFNALDDVITNYRTGQSFEILGETSVAGEVYFMTRWSVEHGKWNGFDAHELQNTVPVVNEVPPTPPPTPIDPLNDQVNGIEVRVGVLEALVNKIVEFLQSIFKGFNK